VIGFIGPFGDSNYGDYAMFVNDVLSLKTKEIMVFSYNSSLINILSQSFFKDIKVNSISVDIDYSYNTVFSNIFHVEYDNRAYTTYEIIKAVKNTSQVRDAVKKLDKLVVCGGGYFNHIWSAKHRKAKLLAIMGTILLAEEQHKEIVFLGNTFGPFSDSEGMFTYFFNSLKHAKIASRDALLSLAEMRSIGYQKDIDVIPDDLYFLDKALLGQPRDDYAVCKENYIIWECYCSINELEENIHRIQKFVDEVYLRLGFRIVFLPLDGGFGGTEQAKLIKDKVNNVIVYELTDGFVPVDEMNSMVKNAKFVISQRYHLFLTALSLNTPCIITMREVQGDFRYYHTKAKGLLDQVFANQPYEEGVFISSNMWDSLKQIPDDFYNIVLKQWQLFNELKEEAESNMLNKRNDYLKKYLS
jgi:polysaccharide pyruvyl transferase WcaK-like protein